MGINCFAKTLLSRYLCVFNKNEVNFTRSCAFAQKVKFYALEMLKKQSLTHPKAAKLATLHRISTKSLLSPCKSDNTTKKIHFKKKLTMEHYKL